MSPPAPTRREVGAALLASVRRDRDRELRRYVERYGVDQLAAAARHHGVEGLTDLALARLGAATTETRAARLGAAAVHLRACAALWEVACGLDAADVPFAVVKGPVLAAHYYPRPDLRRYVDLDVLVAPGDFALALHALESGGCTVLDRNWPLLERRLSTAVRLRAPYDVVVDLHWHLVPDASLRRRVAMPTVELLGRRRHVDVGGAQTPTLAATDTLLHLCVHSTLSGGARVVWLVDVDRVLQREGLTWSEVVGAAEAAGLGAYVGLVLGRARDYLGTPVPREVTARLGPWGSWRAALGAADRWSTLGVARTDASAYRLVTRATRPGTASSWARLGGRSAAWLTHRTVRPRARDAVLDASNRGSGLYAAGGPADRDRYLAAVADQG